MSQMEIKRIASVVGKLLLLILFGIAAWYLLSPLFLNRTVDEALPFAEPTPTVFVGFLVSSAETAPQFPADDEIGVILPPTAQATSEPSTETNTAESAAEAMAKIFTSEAPSTEADSQEATATATEGVETPSNTPTILGQGQLVDGDSLHKGSGLATLYGLADGSHLLRFDDLTATSGPDLHVLLSPNAAPTDHASLGEYLDLGKLKGNIGDQNYAIAAGIDLTQYQSVVIYCLPFEVIFATAALE